MMASRRSNKNLRISLRDSISKKLKNGVEEETLDCISQLPDAVLLQILSLLPTNDAVKSCVLSKRWRYLWTSIYNFLFIDRNYNNVENFTSFVDHVLTHSTCPKIKKFQVDFHHGDWEFDCKISQWLSFAVKNKVEDVMFNSYPSPDEHSYELPLCMYTCSSLITLYLSHWVFDKGLVIAWNSLKSLTLDSTTLEDDDIVILLSSCPVLETMELSFCVGCHRLEITSSNLKRLTIDSHLHHRLVGYGSLEIFAPHLQHLDISGELFNVRCRLVNVSSLVIASLTFSITCITVSWDEDDIEEDSCRDHHQDIRNLILDYLEKLSYVTELIIGSWFAEVVFMMKLEGVMLPELRCKCLTLKSHVTEYNLYGIASLLQTSPLLESLNIHIEDKDFNEPPCQLEQSYFAEVDKINLPSWIPDIVFPNLKSVKIVGCITQCLKEWSKAGYCKLFELSKFLLKNAVALQKLVIVAKRRKCCICSENCVSRHLSRVAKKLIDTPRSSTNFVIIYQEIA
ncbi:LOW QUALITY PROTEIN: F-box/LRR-repeat protein At3g03360-like [Lycium ferocissimum]|uniref:LOW QUALITY PROTEIN: F-box/LRR-repeat protein At3g03360-like n=1 Tax=Lycium ferocissimum TaxID=112874 RepID=UPI0028159419|nr:LOW QUALITY PROTEIN: F-box/LRR-repeat protein At3g03360-like [Lycium ferocissimum]